ncbi:hypothetical protein ABVT39_005341, partial [Epinephelus coioides]
MVQTNRGKNDGAVGGKRKRTDKRAGDTHNPYNAYSPAPTQTTTTIPIPTRASTTDNGTISI